MTHPLIEQYAAVKAATTPNQVTREVPPSRFDAVIEAAIAQFGEPTLPEKGQAGTLFEGIWGKSRLVLYASGKLTLVGELVGLELPA